MSKTSRFERSFEAKSSTENRDQKPAQLTFEELESRLLLSVMPLQVEITRFDTAPGNFPDTTGDASFFAEITIGNTLTPAADHRSVRIDSDDGDFEVPAAQSESWSYTEDVNTANGTVFIRIHVIDFDTGLEGEDDEMDVSPVAGNRGELILKFDPLTATLKNIDDSPFPGFGDLQGTDPNFGFFSTGAGDPNKGTVWFNLNYGGTSDGTTRDNDGDGLLDVWETWGINAAAPFDPANLARQPDYRLQPQGANPDHKDLFVEVDSMQGPGSPAAVATEAQALTNVINAFANVPAFNSAGVPLVSNPDGKPGITLHAALDETGIPWDPWTTVDAFGWPAGFDAIKRDTTVAPGGFGTASEQQSDHRTTILEAKKLAYRYAIFGDQFAQANSIIANGQTLAGAGNLVLNPNSIIANGQTLAVAGNLVLKAGAANLGLPAQQVAISSVGNDSGLTFTIFGTDFAGNPINEFLTGANAGVASSVNRYQSVTQIAVSGATAADVSVGTFVANLGLPAKQVAISSVGDDSGLTFTIFGTDFAGNPINENLTGTNAGVASSVLRYQSVTQIAVSGATAANVSAGTVALVGNAGLGEVGENDFMITLGAAAIPGGTLNEQAATFMHELGHTLGLSHDGGQTDGATDFFNWKPNYHSLMNYTWSVALLGRSK